ncbi:hypothetical protein ACC853_39020, partial [Rhizobium johnstonii]
DKLMGAAGNYTLIGGAGADTMLGGTGDDIYLVDIATDILFENANEGTDTVRTALDINPLKPPENPQLTI